MAAEPENVHKDGRSQPSWTRRTSSTMPLTPPYVAFPARRGALHHGRLQCQGGRGLGSLAFNHRASWDREDEREWPKTSRAVLLPRSCNHSTFFEHKDQHKVSWRHPRSKHWHQLDMILCKKRDLSSVKDTRSMHSAECDTDHILVRSKINLTPRKMHHSKTKSLPRINASRASCKFVAQRLQEALRTSLGRGRGDACAPGT